MENASNDLILQYKPLVYKVYNKYYKKHFAYLKDDLIQCGYWGLYLAQLGFNTQRSTNFINYAYKRIRSKMSHYIDHEKHHITKEEPIDDNMPTTHVDIIHTLDLEKAINKLTTTQKQLLYEWLSYQTFDEMNFKSRQLAHYHFNKILKQLKKELNYGL